MSMTESEAIEVLKQPCLCDYDLSHTVETCDISYCDKREATHMAITALSEIQQYRAIGTVEEIKKKIESLKYDCTRYEEQLSIARCEKQVFTDDDMLLEEYRAIGTVSEFRELKEKATAKKVVTKGQGHETDCYCPNPNCNKFLGDDQDWCFNQTKHCSECGQALEEY